MSNERVIWCYWGHEPSDHLKRMHNPPSIFTLGEWEEEWQDRIHGEELLKKASDAGVNLIYTHFFKGFGLKHEYGEMEKTKRIVNLGHKYEIKVLGYCQLSSLYYETLKDEIENLEDWTVRNHDGTISCWTDAYYRWKPCYNSVEFIDYIKKVIDYGLDNIGLDGFYFDNSYTDTCYCKRCTEKFRKYLEDNIDDPRKVMGLSHFKHVRIPYFSKPLEACHDPLYFYYQRYKQELCSKTLRDLFLYINKKANHKAIIAHNPAFPRNSLKYNEACFEPSLTNKEYNYIFAENSDFLRIENSKLKSQLTAYKCAQRFGYQVFESSWMTFDENTDRPTTDFYRYPNCYEEISRYLSQAMIYNNMIGTHWLFRSTRKGSEVIYDKNEQKDLCSKVFKYYNDNFNLYKKENKPFNFVKVLYYPENLIGLMSTGLDYFKDIVNQLGDNGMPFSLVTGAELNTLDNSNVLLVPNLFFADEDIYSKIKKLALKGCRVMILDDFGICNLYGKERSLDSEIRRIFEINNVFKANSKQNWFGTLKDLVENKIILSEKHIMTETNKDKYGNLLIHLLNPDNSRIIPFLNITLEGGLWGKYFESAEIFSFEDVKIDSYIMNEIKICNFKTMATIKLLKQDYIRRKNEQYLFNG